MDLSDQQFFTVRNNSGETIPPHAVMAVTGVEVAEGALVHVVTKPSTTFYRSLLINNITRIKAGKYGDGTPGTALAIYDSGTPANGETWGPKPGQWSLSKNYPGFIILGVVDASNKVALVRPEEINMLHGKADADIAKGASGTVSIWIGAGGSEADSTINITCYARGAAVSSGKIVKVEFINGVAYVLPWEC